MAALIVKPLFTLDVMERKPFWIYDLEVVFPKVDDIIQEHVAAVVVDIGHDGGQAGQPGLARQGVVVKSLRNTNNNNSSKHPTF